MHPSLSKLDIFFDRVWFGIYFGQRVRARVGGSTIVETRTLNPNPIMLSIPQTDIKMIVVVTKASTIPAHFRSAIC